MFEVAFVSMADQLTLPPDFYRLYEGLPRQGPGSDELTREALRRLRPLPPSPRVLDIGCGSGRQTLVLARDLQAPIVAVDNHEPFLRELEKRAAAASLSHLVETRLADMATLDLPAATIDLIWSEGAIFIVGFERGLRAWQPWLAPGGKLALTECSWLIEKPAAEIKRFWDGIYPEIGSVAVNCQRARHAGLRVIDTFVLPPSAWWDDYYTPLLARLDELEEEALAAGRDAGPAIAGSRQEIDLFRRFSDTYGYVFYLFEKA